MNRIQASLMSAAAALTLGPAMPMAQAQGYVPADLVSGGAGVCQAALPAFEGLVRKRPRAIQNEGNSTAFVTCAPPQYALLSDPESGLRVQVLNNGGSPVTVNCTGVTQDNLYLARSTTMAAGGSGEMSWDEDDGDGVGSFVAISCALPPGVGIGILVSTGRPVPFQ